MYKLDFYIAVSDKQDRRALSHFEKVSGYGETLRTSKGREIEFGFDKRDRGWYVTEVSSGMAIPTVYETRMKALAALNNEMLSRVDKAMSNESYKAVTKKLNEYKTKCTEVA